MACRIAMVAALAFAGALVLAHSPEIDQLLERADRPDFSILTPEGRQLLDRLLDQVDHADPRQLVRIRLIQSRNLALDGDYERAIETLSHLTLQDMEADLYLRVLELQANLLLQIDRYHEAFGLLEEAVELASDVDSSVRQGRVYSLAAYWYGEVGATGLARELARRAGERVDDMNDPWQACITLEKMVLAWRAMDELFTARRVADKALSACRKAGDPVYISAATRHLGQIHFLLGNDERAESLLIEAIDTASENGYVDGLLQSRLALAELLERQQRLNEADQLLIASIDEMESRQRWRHLKDARRLAGAIAHQKGDHETAYQHFSRYLDAHERHLRALRSRAVAFHEVRHGAKAREQELQFLREQAQLEELEDLARRQQWRIQLIGFSLIAILVVILALLILHTIQDRRYYRTLSRRDSLSGLRNHTSFFEAADEAVQRCQRKNKPATMVLGDIDHFKQINDTYGHLVGDDIIRLVASRLQETFGRHGVTGRIGGEEFAVLLPGKDEQHARELVEKLRRALRKTRQSDPEQRVTISFGIAQSGGTSTIDELRQAADDALYDAKHAGRDQVIVAGKTNS